MKLCTKLLLVSLIAMLACGTPASQAASAATSPAVVLQTTLRADDLDPAAFEQWSEGTAAAITVSNGPRHVIWTRDSAPEWDGAHFGDGKQPTPRHLRIGFKSPIEVGSVLVRGGGKLSVLKPDAAAPGNLADESQWIAATRVSGRDVTQDEVPDEQYAIWVLPPHTSTRALRFTHTPAPTDRIYSGWLGGAVVLADRLANVAPQAAADASRNRDAAGRINDQTNNGTWQAWDNGEHGGPRVVTADNPEWITLTWPRAVSLRGLCALWAGFAEADAQIFAGSAGANPSDAPDSDWQTIRHFDGLESQYPRSLGLNFLDFGRTIKTRAVRLRITKVTTEAHPHLQKRTEEGRRVWLGELTAFVPLGDGALKDTVIPVARPTDAGHPPIAIHFTLPQPGFVTLVIEEASSGDRVRNLISETHFEAGPQVVWWDGMDDLGRDTEAARHGIYSTPGKPVHAGEYRVRGLYRGPIDLHYEFAVYNPGNPPWETADSTGAWLANHTPPSSTLFVPADRAPGGKPLVYLGSYVTEGGSGLAWVDLEGRKQGGRGWIGGVWTGAPYLASDAGPHRVPGVSLYAGAAWEKDLRITAITDHGDKAVSHYVFPGGKDDAVITGLAVLNGVVACSLPKEHRVMFLDAEQGKAIGSLTIDDPRGLAFDAKGRLLVLAGKKLQRYAMPAGRAEIKLAAPEAVGDITFEDPQHVTLDQSGSIYVSDRGTSHQVKGLDDGGKLLRTIGHAGVPKAGVYDPLHMNKPNGLTIDSNNHLWVAETDFQPKRVSVWTLDGKFVNAFYGPSEYGGGGTLDPSNKSRFYFHGMEFHLDWKAGSSELVDVFSRPGATDLKLPEGFGAGGIPETPLYANNRRYFTNCYTSNPTNGASAAFIWLEQDGVALPVAGMGRVSDWPLLRGNAFKNAWPKLDLTKDQDASKAVFLWNDTNGDRQVQPDEVTFAAAEGGGFTVMPDLSILASRIGDRAMRFTPDKFTDKGTPLYRYDAGQVLVEGAQSPTSSGGDQALLSADGWTVLTVAPKPFAPQSVGGSRNGKQRWSYPSLWPGLHASHESPPPDHPGELIGTTRLLGGFVAARGSDAGQFWAVNGNMGNMYVFTADGLFVATLFRDQRDGQSWAMPIAQRNMLLNNLTLHDENFWPSITKTLDAGVYLVDGGRSSLVRVDGLDSVHRIEAQTIHVTDEQLHEAQAYFARQEAARQKDAGRHTLKVAIATTTPTVDGKLEDWTDAAWATIDKRGVAAYFDSNTKPYQVEGAVAVAGDRLYAAFRSNEPELLKNSGESPNALFKTGGALDLMIGADPAADPSRAAPVAGDLRLLVTLVKDKPAAVLYRAKVPGTTQPVPFASPWRSITIDRVDDVSNEIQLAHVGGNYELSIPLSLLGLKPSAGTTINADIGVLRGNGFQTVQRVYWNNKATGIVSDVPSEAELTPSLWGKWDFIKKP